AGSAPCRGRGLHAGPYVRIWSDRLRAFRLRVTGPSGRARPAPSLAGVLGGSGTGDTPIAKDGAVAPPVDFTGSVLSVPGLIPPERRRHRSAACPPGTRLPAAARAPPREQ